MELDNVADIYPLSPTQAGMLFHTARAQGTGVYVGIIQCLLTGSLETAVFRDTWQEVLLRHPALRTAFLWDGLDEPLQVVRQHIEPDWDEMDWSAETGEVQKTRLDERLENERRQGFDLSKAPLMRMLLVRLDDRLHRFVWICHHILLDGWSATIVLDEVVKLYAAKITGEQCSLPEAPPYRDYLTWLRSLNAQEADRFWRNYLDGFVSRTSLRTPLVTQQSGAKPLQRVAHSLLDSDVTASLLQSAKELRLTINTLVHGAWAMLLQRYSEQDDLVFGTTVAGRPADLPGVEQCVGLFINTLPVRVRMDDGQRLRDWLAVLQDNLLQIRQHEHTPLTQVQHCSDIPGGEALFDTIVVMENYPDCVGGESDGAELKIIELDSLGPSNYPLAVLVFPGRELGLMLVYDPSIYADDTVTGIIGHLRELLASIPAHLDRAVRDLPIRSAESEHTLLVEWNRTARELPGDTSVLDLIAGQVSLVPESTALSYMDQRLTYRELASASDRLARYLLCSGVYPGDRVAICMERGLELITAILAVLKAGGVYVPLDPDYPGSRLGYMMRDSGAVLLLTQSGLEGIVPLDDGIRQVMADMLSPPALDQYDQQVLPATDNDSPAYLIYTSGSTGSPKGVLVSHHNLLASTLARHVYYRDAPGVFLLLSSVAFDSSIAGIFWSLTTGANLAVGERRIEQDIQRLAGSIDRLGVTHTLCLPSLFDLLLEFADPGQLASLKTVILAGETLKPATVASQRSVLPEVSLFNEYGPTEATVWCSVYDTAGHVPGAPVPIGHPIANARIYILDRQHRPVPCDVPGELYVGGEGVACGYWNNAEATAERFVTLTIGGAEQRLYRTGDLGRYLPDGDIEFLGRVDRQIKLRGYRIEPGEIEAALLQLRDVREAVVLLTEEPADNNGYQELTEDSPQRITSELLGLDPSEAETMLSMIEDLSDEEALRMIAAREALLQGH